MADAPINLNKARKAKAKSAAETKAVENRVTFGRTKAEKQVRAVTRAKALRELEGHKRER